ncbi:MAG TPA: hypothetical protein PKE55_07090 [Kiritimatiellia bacterium]|nr:hypothetical protein [Kiritimatiellia bacterium]
MDWIRSIFANSGPPLELLIYFIVVVLWVLGQFSQRKKRRERQRPRDPATEAEPAQMSDLERHLKEMMKEWSPEPEDEPPPPVRPARPPRRRPPEIIQRRAEPPPPPAVSPLRDLAMADIPDIADVGVGTDKMFSGTFNNVGFRFAVNTMTIPAIRQAMSLRTSAKDRRPVINRATVASRTKLREASAMRVVLGPPKALETTPWPD